MICSERKLLQNLSFLQQILHIMPFWFFVSLISPPHNNLKKCTKQLKNKQLL